MFYWKKIPCFAARELTQEANGSGQWMHYLVLFLPSIFFLQVPESCFWVPVAYNGELLPMSTPIVALLLFDLINFSPSFISWSIASHCCNLLFLQEQLQACSSYKYIQCSFRQKWKHCAITADTSLFIFTLLPLLSCIPSHFIFSCPITQCWPREKIY